MLRLSHALIVVSLFAVGACQRDSATVSPEDIAASASDVGDARPALAEYNLEDSVALQGYDPVAYFPEGGGAPKPGVARHSVRYHGVLYAFANRKNLDAFVADPEKYEPAYGGWCAWAMVRGNKVDADPENFLIQDGRLMVFYRNAVVDTRKKWNAGATAQLEVDADAEWKTISGEG